MRISSADVFWESQPNNCAGHSRVGEVTGQCIDGVIRIEGKMLHLCPPVTRTERAGSGPSEGENGPTTATRVLSVMAFHEKAGPGQVDFDLPFLKFPFPS